MKRFKLIKEYPGSPKLETISEQDELNCWLIPDNDEELSFSDLNYFPPQYPEFWEEVIEKDYEILSFICTSEDSNHELSTRLDNGNHIWLNDSYPKENRESYLLTGEYKIHSVKRLSNGEIFTVGDKITGKSKYNCIINSIELNPKFHQIMFNRLDEGIDLINAKHIKQPLFTTEDSVDIFEGDTFYYVKFKENKFSTGRVFEIVTAEIPGCVYEPQYEKYFSTIEKAKEYILMNKKSLSPNDILKVWSKLSGHSVESLLKNSKLMHRIITSIK